ncbi:MAG: ABC transporter substrate-binding protein [Deltaproteobacteria bacterium]|nr:ABC transporter substrate-binding protein [Deltaproteobacteria bacterium]
MKYCPVCDREYEDGEQCPDDGTVLLEKKASLVDALAGTLLKNTYRIGDKIGQGGMGTVFRAEQLPLGRRVAVKVINADEQQSDSPIKRFYREAKQLSALSHPNIVHLIDFGNTGSGLIYFVMECLEGLPLDDLVPARRPLPVAEVCRLFEQICAGVGAAHTSGLIHRDLKPSNVFIARVSDGSEIVKLLDFGIAKSLDQHETSNLTKTGSIVGTVGYIAPELITGDASPSVASDVYSLGGVLYFMLTGNQAYDGPSTRSILIKQLSAPPEPLDFDRFGYPDSFKQVVLKAMAIDPAARYRSTAELARALREAAGAAVELPPAGAKPPSDPALGEVSTTALTGELSSTSALTPDDVATGTLHHPAVDKKGTAASSMPPLMPQPSAPPPAVPATRAAWVIWLAIGSVVVIGVALAWFLWLRPGTWPATAAAPDSSSASQSASRPSALTPVAEANYIVMGWSGDWSGINREKGRQILAGLKTAFGSINNRGGVHDRPLEVVGLDDVYDPARARENARSLITDSKVVALIGNQGTATTEAVLPIALEHKTILFGACTGASALKKDPPDRYVFNYRPRYGEEVAALARYLVKQRKIQPTQIAALAQDDDYGREGTDALRKQLAELGHPSPDRLVVAGYPRDSADVSTAVRTILAHRSATKAIVMLATYKPAARFIKEIREARMAPVFASISGIDAEAFQVAMQEVAPQYDSGVIVTQVVPHVLSKASGVLRFREDLKFFAPQEHPTSFTLEAYIAANIFAEGLRRAGPDFDSEKLADAFEQIKDYDLGTGVICRFGPSDHQCSDKVWALELDEQGQYQTLQLD